jgi:cytochrome oxidase Cu insertion factor (SCO1/SenC/PrrC family)
VTLRAFASVSPRVSAWVRLGSLGAVLVLAPLTPNPALSQEPDPVRAARWMDDLMWGHGHVGGPFALIDHTGRKRTDADFRGKLLIVYFGYTTCPDVCPADLIQISLAIDQLGTAGENIQPLFVSLDPERDTPSVLARYVSAFQPRLIGLTGTREQVRAVADAYKAYYAQYVPSAGAVDVIDHTGFIYLVDRDGQYIGFFPPGTSADRLLDIIRPHLARH